MKEGTKVQPKPKTEQERMKEFFDDYQKLCEERGFRIVVNPAFQARDDGTWSVVLQTSIGRLPKQEVDKRTEDRIK